MIINGKHDNNPKNHDYIKERYNNDFGREVNEDIRNGRIYRDPDSEIQKRINEERKSYREHKAEESEITGKVDDREDINKILSNTEESEMLENGREGENEL
jgi:hypothetical protein